MYVHPVYLCTRIRYCMVWELLSIDLTVYHNHLKLGCLSLECITDINHWTANLTKTLHIQKVWGKSQAVIISCFMWLHMLPLSIMVMFNGIPHQPMFKLAYWWVWSWIISILVTFLLVGRDVPTVVGTDHHSDKIATTTNLLINTKISTPTKMLGLHCQLLYVIHTYVHM